MSFSSWVSENAEAIKWVSPFWGLVCTLACVGHIFKMMKDGKSDHRASYWLAALYIIYGVIIAATWLLVGHPLVWLGILNALSGIVWIKVGGMVKRTNAMRAETEKLRASLNNSHRQSA